MRTRKYRLMPMPMATRERLARAVIRLAKIEVEMAAHRKSVPTIREAYADTCVECAKGAAAIEREGAKYKAERERFERESKAHGMALHQREELKAAGKDPNSVSVPEVSEVDGAIKRAWLELLDTADVSAHLLYQDLTRLTEWEKRRDALVQELAAARAELAEAIGRFDKARDDEAEAAANVAREEKEIRAEEEAEAREEFAEAEAKMRALGLR